MYSFNATINYPNNTEKDLRIGIIRLSEPALIHELSLLIREEPKATSFVITIVKHN